MRRLAGTSLLVAFLATSLSLAALAQEEGEEGGEGTTPTSIAVDPGLEPAVEIVDEPAAPTQPDWTYRYMIPTALALAAVIILVTAIKYFTDVVRKRYRIIEE